MSPRSNPHPPWPRSSASLRSTFDPLLAALILGVSAANTAFAFCGGLADKHGTTQQVIASIRIALPLFFVAFTASSLATLAPGATTRWLLRHRRSFGLAFAVGLAWHLAFVSYLALRFGLTLNKVALVADATGALSVLVLAITSLRRVSRHTPPRVWRLIHRVGMYAVWLLILYIYQGTVRDDRDPISIFAFSAFMLAGVLRAVARLSKLTGRNRTTDRPS